jgi:hypothetical protein
MDHMAVSILSFLSNFILKFFYPIVAFLPDIICQQCLRM